MKRKTGGGLVSVVIELLAVLLLTVALFIWGKDVAMAERGYEAIGGEYLFLLLPFAYYPVKRTILGWIAEINKLLKDEEDNQ